MLALFVAAVTAPPVNDGWYIVTGSEQPFKSEHTTIQMVKEHVHMELGKDVVDVRVEFEFKNHGPATTVQMGFPERGGNNMSDGLERFRSTVDGVRVSVKRQMIEQSEDDFDAVWLKSVRFEKDQTRRVVNTYRQAISGNTHGSLSTDYIFSTGKSWRSHIEEIRLTYAFDPKNGYSDPFPSRWVGETDGYREPLLATVTGKHSRKIVWKNVEPDFTFDLSMMNGFWKVEVNGLLIPCYVLTSAPTGKPTDLFVDEFGVERVFGKPSKVMGDDGWTRGISLDDEYLTSVFGKRVKLRRPKAQHPIWPENTNGPYANYVYLRDVVEALGGTYRYDPKLDKVFITVPKEGK